MLLNNGDGTFTAGPLDVMIIYHNVLTDTYHPAFYEERPMPGPATPAFVRLFSKVHHIEGAKTLEGAQALLAELRAKIKLDDLNVESEHPMPWDGELGHVLFVPNWRKGGVDHPFSSVVSMAID